MKANDVLKVLAQEFGTADSKELNKLLKARAKEKIKFKFMGPSLGYLGLTVAVKNITPEGLKIYDTARVRLIRYAEFDSFEKAKQRVRPVYTTPKPSKLKASKEKPAIKGKSKFKKIDNEEDDEEDFGDDFSKGPRHRKSFIPTK